MPTHSLRPFLEFVDQAILPRLAAEAAYRSVRFTDTRGRFWQGICPFHQEDRSWPMYVDSATLRWSCPEGCRKGGQSFLVFLNGGQFPRAGSGELRRCLHDAAALAGLPSSRVPEWTAEDELHILQDQRVASLLETFFFHASLALRVETASSGRHSRELARSWLEDQGFDLPGLDDLPLGLFTDGKLVRAGLLSVGFTAEEIDASALADDPRLAGRLVGPIRDRWGRILSFWARHPEDRPPRFLFKGKWKDEAALFGLDVALRATSGEAGELIVVQRLLDSLLLQSKGLPSAVAVGGSPRELGKRRFQHLSALGVRRLILAFEPADDGCRDTLAALERAFRVKPAIEVFVLPPESLRGYRGPAELVRAEGVAALQRVLKTESVHAYGFKASAILGRHKAGRPWTDARRHAAWKEAVEFYALQRRRAAPGLDSHFVPAIVAGLQRTWDTLMPCGEGRRESEVPGQPAARRSSATCPIHHCDATTCFCFD